MLITTEAVQIKPITSANREEALYLAPRMEQQSFIPTVEESLKKAARSKAMAFGVYADSELVGFFTLNPRQRTLWIEGFFIDQSFQRRGLASEAVNQIPALARRISHHFDTLAVQVHPSNIVCDSFYNKLGFFNAGTGQGGSPIYVYRL